MVGEDVNFFDVQMCLVHAIGAVDNEFVGSELLDVGLFLVSYDIEHIESSS